MRKLFFLIPCLILCGGLGVAPFDAHAVPAALAARQLALKLCNARTDFKSNDELLDCIADADRGFAAAIHLRDNSLVTDYTGRVKALESDVANGAVKPADVTARLRDVQNEFFKAVNESYSDYQSAMAQDTLHDMNDAAARAAQQDMRSGMNGMGGMNGMNGMNGMGN